jgi:hypothetical protein
MVRLAVARIRKRRGQLMPPAVAWSGQRRSRSRIVESGISRAPARVEKGAASAPVVRGSAPDGQRPSRLQVVVDVRSVSRRMNAGGTLPAHPAPRSRPTRRSLGLARSAIR